MKYLRVFFAFFLGLLSVACQQPVSPIGEVVAVVVAEDAPMAEDVPTAEDVPMAEDVPTAVFLSPTPTLAPTATAAPTLTPTETAVPATPTAVFTTSRSPACGQILPLLPNPDPSLTSAVVADPEAVAELRAMLPAAAQTALDQIMTQPQNVGLAYYRMGQEASGAYLNADAQMPLASVVKLITLAAYVEAVAAGQLNPLEPVGVDTLDRYYLPNSDLGAHPRALEDAAANGRLNPTTNTLTLNDVAWMMIRHSSNAASDYLHLRLGQHFIEETALWLNLTQQTAPCPFLAQFLALNNHTRSGDSAAIVQQFIAEPASYASEAMLLADAYIQDADFRTDERSWRSSRQGGGFGASRPFYESLNAEGTAREYAALMGRFAQNGLSSGESSYQARLILEWPMQFADNQALFSNLGYKNGSLPGILTVAYYAYPQGESDPIIVTLFFRDLPNDAYRSWRSDTLAHDELARWLLANPQAIPLLRRVLTPVERGE
ncbi:MAG: serine hydrolase [Anaerolineales bacterium]|nr:serine hydrolase [Anaerolineales bacterium]